MSATSASPCVCADWPCVLGECEEDDASEPEDATFIAEVAGISGMERMSVPSGIF